MRPLTLLAVKPVQVSGIPRSPQRDASRCIPTSGSGPRRSGTNSTRPRPCRATHVEQRRRARRRRRGATAPCGRWRSSSKNDVDSPHAPALMAASRMSAMRAHSSGGRGALPRVVAHHHEPQRGVAHERGDVDTRAARVDRVAVAGVVVPCPRHVVDQRVGRHVLHEREHVGDRDALLVGDGEQRERAVADQRGGDAVLGLRVARRVPEHLRVEVGVQVEEAGGDDRAGRRRARARRRARGRSRSRRCGRGGPGRRRRCRARRCRRRPCRRGRGGHVHVMPCQEDGTRAPRVRRPGQKGSGEG